MIVTRLFEPAIAQASYLIGCAATGQAVVIDPTRDLDRYVQAAEREGVRITHVTETHIHADFASGARELAARTGATLFLSDEGDENWKYAFANEATLIRHGDRLTVGNILVDVVATPGHTPEHLTFLITDGAAADRPIAAATGDFLFVGDVGRPDLLERAAHMAGTMEASARTLWRSLRAFDAQEEWLQIWPGHGAGSSCGKGISAVPYSTLGYERRFNWAFRVASETDFVARVLEGQPDPPTYFAVMKRLNKAGPPARRGDLPPVLDPDRLPSLLGAGALVIDARATADYAAAHVPGTLNIPLGGSFVTWAGWLVPYDADFYVVLSDTSEAARAEVTRLLALIGLDRVAGVFAGGALARAVEGGTLDTVSQTTPAVLADQLAGGQVQLIDVRNAAEWGHGHIAGARHLPLGHLAEHLAELPSDRPIVVHCQGGTRSSIAASLLRKLGRTDVTNLTGGLDAWQAARRPVVET